MPKKDTLPAISAKHLARLAGLSPNHLIKLANAGHIPTPTRGKFNAEEAIAALFKYYRDEGSAAFAAAKLRHVDAQTEDVRQRTAIRSGKSAPMDELQTVFDATVNIFAASMDGMGGRTCHQLAAESNPAVVKGIIDEETRRIRQSAATSLAALAHAREGR